MTLPLLPFAPSSQNHRVEGFEIPGDEIPTRYTLTATTSAADTEQVIWAAYRQIFNEQQIIEHNRLKTLESQLKFGQITVKDFIRNLALSDSFRQYTYDANNNYRFVRLCLQRLLGREPYSDRETYAWSTVLATRGLRSFVDALLDSEEYANHFGDDTVPYQRRRILPQRSEGQLPIARTPRYEADYRDRLIAQGYFRDTVPGYPAYRWEWQKPPYPLAVRRVGQAVTILGAALLAIGAIAVFLAALDLMKL